MKALINNYLWILVVMAILFSCQKDRKSVYGSVGETNLYILENQELGTIEIYRKGGKSPILTQHARPNHRPYIHPIIAPDGKGVLTEYSPSHHQHQTGLYGGSLESTGTMNWFQWIVCRPGFTIALSCHLMVDKISWRGLLRKLI